MSKLISRPDHRMGWIPPDERKPKQQEAHEMIVASMVGFFIAQQTRSSEGAKVFLWDAFKQIFGRVFPTFKQNAGSCVGMGIAMVIWIMQAIEIANGDPEELVMPFEPWGYQGSRILIGGGRLGDDDGSLGSWAAELVKTHGVLRSDLDGLPKPITHTDRDGNVVCVEWPANLDRQWGNSRAKLNKWAPDARDHVVRTVSKVNSYEQVRDAIANGYPCTVASNRGFAMTPKEDDGKMWARGRQTWHHQMCYLAVDDNTRRPGVWCQNSWGPDAHGEPLGDTPAGGFWIDAETVDEMARQGETFAFSQFDGFPEQQFEWSML